MRPQTHAHSLARFLFLCSIFLFRYYVLSVSLSRASLGFDVSVLSAFPLFDPAMHTTSVHQTEPQSRTTDPLAYVNRTFGTFKWNVVTRRGRLLKNVVDMCFEPSRLGGAFESLDSKGPAHFFNLEPILSCVWMCVGRRQKLWQRNWTQEECTK